MKILKQVKCKCGFKRTIYLDQKQDIDKICPQCGETMKENNE